MNISFESLLQSDEPFMGPYHKAFFRQELLKLRKKILKKHQSTSQGLAKSDQESDTYDQASHDTEWLKDTSLCNQSFHMLQEVDAALKRLDNDTYGYCEDSGEPINIYRLKAFILARYGIESQEKRERQAKISGGSSMRF